MSQKVSHLDHVLVKLCLYKIRQIKLCLKKEDPRKIYESICREERLVHSLPKLNSINFKQKALYFYYQILERRLIYLMEQEKENLKREFHEHKLRSHFNIN